MTENLKALAGTITCLSDVLRQGTFLQFSLLDCSVGIVNARAGGKGKSEGDVYASCSVKVFPLLEDKDMNYLLTFGPLRVGLKVGVDASDCLLFFLQQYITTATRQMIITAHIGVTITKMSNQAKQQCFYSNFQQKF